MAEVTSSSLEAALRSNRKVQAEIIRRAQSLVKEKAENRRLASLVAAQLSATWDRLEEAVTEPPRPGRSEAARGKTDEEREEGHKPTKPSGGDNKQNYLRKKWRYDPYRKWLRRFFVDPDGSTPRPNEDTRRRRTLEQGKTFFHDSPPWSTQELETLDSLVTEILACSGPTTVELNEEVLERIDFDRVAQSLNEQISDSAHSRTTSECRVKYRHSINASAFTEEESLRLFELVQLQNDHPSWCQISSDLGTNRTAWQCFVAYQSEVSRSQPTLWTPAQDELLLKFAAAMGPQWVFNVGAAAKMSRLFPDKSPKQILARAHASLVNPTYVRDVWSDEEERKLVLCMKVYRDESSPLVKVARHFPGRATKSVSEKWHRCLDPDLSSRPFTREEDQALMEVVKHSVSLEWTQIARQFPGRHSRTLANRWTELASHGDFMELCAQQGIVDSAGVGTVLARPNDYFVREKPGTKLLEES